LLAALSLAPALPPGKTSVAIYPIKAAGATDKAVASALSALLSSELTPSTRLYVIEEGMLKTVMERNAMNISDACDDTSCQVEIGKLVKAQKMITGDLVKLGSRYILSLKLVDIQSGTMEFSTRDECSCTEDQVDQLVASAALKIREHYGETGLTAQAPPPAPESAVGERVPSPAQPSAKGSGSLSIATEPAGAEVYLDAELKGKTPLTLSSVPAGTHSLTLMKKGYSPLPKEIVVSANTATPVSERLQKQTGALDITTTPTGAQIFVDDKYQGTAPKKIEGILTGPHQLKAQLANYQAAQQQVEVAYQQTTPVAIELAGLPGKILVTSIPEGAEVKIDGEKKGVTIYTGSLSPGKHRIEVTREGYESVSQEVEIQANKSASLNLPLKKYQKPREKEVYASANFFTVGSHKDDVIRLQGTPDGINKYDALGFEDWSYGYSSIKIDIRTGRVIDFQNRDKNLKVKILVGPNITNDSFFTIGSHKDDVIRLQGTPDGINKYDALGFEDWSYGYSSIKINIRTGRVIDFQNRDKNLKVKI
jgi:hypothetical protein